MSECWRKFALRNNAPNFGLIVSVFKVNTPVNLRVPLRNVAAARIENGTIEYQFGTIFGHEPHCSVVSGGERMAAKHPYATGGKGFHTLVGAG